MFKLSDLMTAKQAQEIIDLLNSMNERLTDVEKKMENMENARKDQCAAEIRYQLDLWNNYYKEDFE